MKNKRLSTRLKVNDEVIVIAGKEKGKRGKIMSINNNKVVVQGVHYLKRFQRPTNENPQGGVLELERPFHISNVAYYEAKTRKGVRLGYEIQNGKKVRILREKGQTYEVKQKEKEN